MKVYVQWATNKANDFEIIDSIDWPNLPTKPAPTGGEKIDRKKGWVCRLNVQGMGFIGDHISVEDKGEYIRVIVWNDDSGDYTGAEFFAHEWIFYPIQQDGKTLQYTTYYYTAARKKQLEDTGQLPVWNLSSQQYVTIKDLSEFVKPDGKYIKHGIWLDDILYTKMRDFPLPKWTDWIGN